MNPMPGSQSPMTRFGLLRHGKTVWNREKRIQGSGNSALTAEGIARCEQWAQFLFSMSPGWTMILASPLQRALDTAAIINRWLGLPIHHDAGLREQNWGLWEGLTLPEIEATFPGEMKNQVTQGWGFRAPGGESRRDVLDRATSSLRRHGVRWPEENILIITHLGVIKALLYHLEERNFLPEEPKLVEKNRFHTISSRDGVLALEKRNIALSAKP